MQPGDATPLLVVETAEGRHRLIGAQTDGGRQLVERVVLVIRDILDAARILGRAPEGLTRVGFQEGEL